MPTIVFRTTMSEAAQACVVPVFAGTVGIRCCQIAQQVAGETREDGVLPGADQSKKLATLRRHFDRSGIEPQGDGMAVAFFGYSDHAAQNDSRLTLDLERLHAIFVRFLERLRRHLGDRLCACGHAGQSSNACLYMLLKLRERLLRHNCCRLRHQLSRIAPRQCLDCQAAERTGDVTGRRSRQLVEVLEPKLLKWLRGRFIRA